ncbi:MAG: energy transducer TonB, partial [Bacteroidia bacterium]|nr:energy transducer TonB [Bacteroidia bacterium]
AEINNKTNPVVNSDASFDSVVRTQELDMSSDSSKSAFHSVITNSLVAGQTINPPAPAEDKEQIEGQKILEDQKSNDGKTNLSFNEITVADKERSGKNLEMDRKLNGDLLNKEKEEKSRFEAYKSPDNNYTTTNGTVLAEEKSEKDTEFKKINKDNQNAITPAVSPKYSIQNTNGASGGFVTTTPQSNMGLVNTNGGSSNVGVGVDGISNAGTNTGTLNFTTTNATSTATTINPGTTTNNPFAVTLKKAEINNADRDGAVDYRAVADSLMNNSSELNQGYFSSNRYVQNQQQNQVKEKDKLVMQKATGKSDKKTDTKSNTTTGNQSTETYSEPIGMNNGMVSTKGGKKNEEKNGDNKKQTSGVQKPLSPQKSQNETVEDKVIASADITSFESGGFGEIDLRAGVNKTKENEVITNTGISNEQTPQYPGGLNSMHSFFKKNIVMPDQAKSKGGRVIVSFAIGVDGSVSGIQVYKSIAGCEDCTKEVIRVIKMMPKWKPGMKAGKPVTMRYNLPVKF